MNHRNLVSRILIIVLGVCCAGPLKADFGLGVAAYKRGDYGIAQLHFQPLAEAGDARGQFALGLLHDNGEGVPRDDAVAASWYARSAAQGYARPSTTWP